MSRRDFISGIVALAPQSLNKSAVKTVAFDYAGKLPLPDLQFLARFDILVTGGILSSDQLQILRSQGTRLVLYQWSSALYPGEGTEAHIEWQKVVEQNARSWLLAPKPVSGGAASSGKGALWYDFGNRELVSALAGHIQAVLAANKYWGVFLDTLGHQALPPDLIREHSHRHPGVDYDHSQGAFIAKLREVLGPEDIIFTNQGYRRSDIFLPHANFDLVENSATVIQANGETAFRPWYDPKTPWESVKVPITNLVLPAAHAFPKVQFVQLNYAAGDGPICEKAVRYSFACAKLWNQTSFVAPLHIQKVIRNAIYFTKLGEPLTDSYEEDTNAGVAWRRFRRGVVAINSSNQPYRIRSLGLNLADPPRGYIFPKKFK